VVLGELPNRNSVNVESPDRLPIVQHRDRNNASNARRRRPPDEGVIGIAPDVRDVDAGSGQDGATCSSMPTGRRRKRLPQGLLTFGTGIDKGGEMNELTVESQHHPMQGAAESQRMPSDCIEDGLQVRR